MKDLIKRIVQALVDNPEQVEVFEVKTEYVSVFELRVAKEDMGKVIGKKGRTAHAIRTILNATSGKQKKHNIFEILEWSRGEKGPKIQALQTKSLIILVWWCGLIINELVSNSLKHAFPQGKEGNISIALQSINEDDLELTVSDDSIGISKDPDIEQMDTMGLHLVKVLAGHQLDGKIELNRTEGTQFNVKFKRTAYKPRI